MQMFFALPNTKIASLKKDDFIQPTTYLISTYYLSFKYKIGCQNLSEQTQAFDFFSTIFFAKKD